VHATRGDGGGLSAAAVLRRLMDRALVTPADAVDRGLSVVDASMSHQGFLVRVGGRPRFFAKRADPVRSGGRDLRVEARVHGQLGALPGLRGLVPRCRLIADGGATIVMDAPDAAPLEPAALLGAGDARALVRQYGAAVARVHAVPAPPLNPAPWLLDALEPRWGAYEWLPEPCRLLLVRLAADPARRAAVRDARRRWSPTGLVHGDLRCANVLVERAGDPPRVWLVDWELACHGDRAWDVAAVLAEQIAAAVLWHPRAAPRPAVEAGAATFLAGYRDAWQAPDPAWAALVRRAVPFAGLKLVQTLLEIGYGDAETFARAEPLLAPWIDELLAPAPAVALAAALAGASAGAGTR
jgi:hypothetical protein